MEKSRGSGWGLAGMGAAAVATLLAGYVGLYYAMVTPRHGWAMPTLPDYGAGQPVAEVLFWPIHRIDRRLRPEAWKGFRDIDDMPSDHFERPVDPSLP